MTILNEKEQQARKRVCFALDASTVNDALNLASELSPYVGVFKVGKELHTSACNEGVPIFTRIFESYGIKENNVFADLKLHDTPNTVGQAARALAIPGIKMYNIHISGGEKMCKAALEGSYSEASKKGLHLPYVIGVTELTSLDDNDLKEQGLGISYNDLVRRRTELARKWGLQGVVCPANRSGALEKEFGSDFLYVTPGIEWAGIHREGQKQLYTPDLAVQDCSSSILVIGGAIAKSKNRPATAYEILQAMAPYV
jgi:orotidine-5'-phosphate decarboxylase